MRRSVVVALAAGVLFTGTPGAAQAASATVMVVARDDALMSAAKKVSLRPRTAKVTGRRCAVAGSTALSGLLGTGLAVRLRDYGSCGSAAPDSSGLYVVAVNGQAERGRGGWVYKIGRRAPSIGAADPAGRVRKGRRVLWFWCEQTSAGGCQRTLEVVPERRRAAAGSSLRVVVRGYDNNGRGVRVAGATVRLGPASAVTGSDGVATLTVPAGAGRLTAQRSGMIRSFPVKVSAS
jgi:hypothetical protein